MKYDFAINLIDKMLDVSETDKKADMHLPIRFAVFGIAMALAGVFFIVISFVSRVYALLFFAPVAFLISAFAFLYYKFQRIYVISDTEFRYTNFLGKRKTYKFSDIISIKFNPDSHTLVMKKGKIFIESSAIISERLKLLFNKELEKIYRESNEKKHR